MDSSSILCQDTVILWLSWDFSSISFNLLLISDRFHIVHHKLCVRTLRALVHREIFISKSNVKLIICSIVLWMTNDNIGVYVKWRNVWLCFCTFWSVSGVGAVLARKNNKCPHHTHYHYGLVAGLGAGRRALNSVHSRTRASY
jgi:hypothetical protein